MEPPEELKLLDSLQPDVVEAAKKRFHELFNSTKDSWLLNGLVDYFVQTGSMRCVDIIVCVREPHDNHFFNKLLEQLRNYPSARLSILTLLSHTVFRQPTWLYKISQHNLFKELLRILKTESDIVILMSALLTLIVLLPMIPAYVGSTLQEIFEVFSRLAAWNTNNPSKLDDDQLIHLQVSLHSLFNRLYGMYPCNFLSFLRQQYGARENLAIFSHTIRPMLETVKMHPLLVTTSKDTETTTTRWKTMEHHDVVVECARLAIDSKYEHSTPAVATFRNRSESELRRIMEIAGYQDLKLVPTDSKELKDLWSPSIHGKATTPPLSAGNEPTAPTSIPQTPIAQSYVYSSAFPHQVGTSPPEAAIEATPETTPVKDSRLYASVRAPPINSNVVRALNQLGGIKRSSSTSTPTSQPSSPMKKEISPFRFPEPPDTRTVQRKVQLIFQDRQKVQPLQMDVINGMKLEEQDDQEDQEVLEISQQGEMRISSSSGISSVMNVRQCDSVLQDYHPPHGEDLELCEQESGSPCPSGGLHMPNSRSMLNFRQHVHSRLRYYSQCANDSLSSGSDLKGEDGESSDATLQPPVVRRAHSCPEIKKEPSSFSTRETRQQELDESQELESGTTSTGTQTDEDVVTPYPYEHMFLALFPPGSDAEARSTAPRLTRESPTTVLDKYLDLAAGYRVEHSSLKRSVSVLESDVKTAKDQLLLLHLQLKFERHRRDIHAERNRRLLGKSRNNRWLEEHNSALRDQLALLEKDIDSLHEEIMRNKNGHRKKEKKFQEDVQFWQDKCAELEKRNKELKTESEKLVVELQQSRLASLAAAKKLQHTEAQLFTVGKELKEATAQANAGEALKLQLGYLHKEFVILGEQRGRSREQVAKLALKSDKDGQMFHDSFQEQVRTLNAHLEAKLSSCDAFKNRVTELEAILDRKNMLIGEQKRALKAVKEECREELEAVETKYKAQVATNRKLECHILDLFSKIELTARRSRRNVSAAQDVLSLAERGGMNSPLSLSLSSSEGLSLSSIVTADSIPARDLQAVLDTPETIRIPDLIEFEDLPGPSGFHD